MRDGPLDETIPGAINISLGVHQTHTHCPVKFCSGSSHSLLFGDEFFFTGQMPFKADCDSGYADVQITAHKSKPVVLTCDGGAQAMLAGKVIELPTVHTCFQCGGGEF
eukprot:SAG31_NODE_1560_length_7876_cov_9.490806_4_plen_108_part_00